MKKILMAALLAAVCVFTGCKYDDSELWENLDDLEARVKSLEEKCNTANSNISALQTTVSALQNNDYVTEVKDIKEGGIVVGYEITFSKSGKIEIYHGESPLIGVKEDAGVYYWTLDGEFILDNGQKIPTTGPKGENGDKGDDGENAIAPQLKIENGKWMMSVDDGGNWTEVGQATGDSMFSKVSNINDASKSITLTLASGVAVELPILSKAPTVTIDLAAAFEPGETRTFPVTLINIFETAISKPDGWKVSLDRDNELLTVTAPAAGMPGADTQGEITVTAVTDKNISDIGKMYVTIFENYIPLVYDGVTYRTAIMKDGRQWMCENLRYIPPTSTLSSNPASDNANAPYMWYTAKNAAGGAAVISDDAGIAERGYYYDAQTAFGVAIGQDNYNQLQNAQGICPAGWHIPSQTEFNALATQYPYGTNMASVTELIKDGFEMKLHGMRQKNNSLLTGTYNTLSGYFWLSTGVSYAVNETTGAITCYLKNVITTYTMTYPKGRMSVANGSIYAGYNVRCIKDL